MLTKKYVYGSLALAVMLACGSAQAEVTKYIDASAGNKDVTEDVNYTGNANYGVYATAGNSATLTGKNINFAISGSGDNEDTKYIGALSDATNGIGGGLVKLGDENTKNITLDVKNTGLGYAVGVRALRRNDTGEKPSKIEVNGENFTINAYSEKGNAVGLMAQNCTANETDLKKYGGEEGRATIIVNAKNTVINVSSGITEPSESGEYNNIGIMNYSQGKVEIKNNLTINAGTAISTRGYAETKINEDGKGTVKINGDINFSFDGPTSNTPVDATVDINLTNKDSFLNGNIFVNGDPFPPAGKDKVNAMNLSMKDGASWTSDKDSFVNNLTLDGGIITAKNANQTITVGNLSGKGGDINLAATTDGNTIKTSTINITGDVSKDSHLNANLTGITADDIKDADNDLASLNEQLKKVDHTNNIAEGDINGAITQNVVNGDTVTVTTTSNTKIDGFNEALILATAQWRHELNSLSKRLGELRSAKDGTGVWARAFGSEYEYGNQTLTNNTIQIGSDFSVAEGFKLGGAVSYTDGSTSAFNGSADNDIYSVALYGTYMAQNGVYVDVVGKYSNITNDFSFQNFTGSYDNDAYSLSLESGWHLKLNDTIFVEPQAEFIYGKILGDDFTASNGVKVHQEDTDALILRGGMRAGFYLPENKGLIYAKASVVHDYDSETKFTASKDGNVTSRTNDLGGTWAEYGIGANINWTDNCYTYFEIERTSGSDLVENYRWNIGTRYVF